jgi:hypothetical protein
MSKKPIRLSKAKSAFCSDIKFGGNSKLCANTVSTGLRGRGMNFMKW